MKGWNNCPRCGGQGFQGLLICSDEPPKGRLYIEENYQQFERLCVPAGAGPDQRRETRDAFFAGAFAVLETLMHEVSDENEMTPDDERLMVCLNREMEAHRLQLHARLIRQQRERQKRGGGA